MISKTSGYAIQMLLYLAKKLEEGKDRYFFVHEIAKDIGVPRNFLSKIAVTLAKKGIIESQKGPKGGISLKVHPDKITLYDICSIFDEDVIRDICILGKDECKDDSACPIHRFWKYEKERIIKNFKSMSIAKLIKIS